MTAQWILESLLFRIATALRWIAIEAHGMGDELTYTLCVMLEASLTEVSAYLLGWIRGVRV